MQSYLTTNSFKTIDVCYLYSNKTIETVLVSNTNREKLFYVYNYEGWFLRVFENILDLLMFFNNAFEPKIYFEDDNELDNYFRKRVII